MSGGNELRVLVVAPQFPAINQPWIDTYLEQLLVHNFDPVIYSAQEVVGGYSPKVDRLCLRQRILPLSLGAGAVLAGAFRGLLRMDLHLLSRAWSLSRALGSNFRSVVSGFLNALHFSQADLDRLDIVHSHDEILAYRFLFLAMLRNIPIVLTFHGLPPAGVGQLSVEKRATLYRSLSRVLVNTEFAKRQVCALGCPPGKVVIIPQGLPIAEFPFKSRSSPASDETLQLLTVGRFHRDKGQAYAILALRRLLNNGFQVAWTFVGVGPDLPRLQNLAMRLGVQGAVRFLVAVPPQELRRLYHESHLFVLPSVANPGGHVETQGVVLQESQACGCVPIASRVGGIPECLHDGIDALLFKQKSSRDLAAKITNMLHEADRWEELQSAARKNVEINYSASAIGSQMADLLADTIRS